QRGKLKWHSPFKNSASKPVKEEETPPTYTYDNKECISDKVPEDGAFYYGIYQGRSGLFFTNSKERKYLESRNKPYSRCTGLFWYNGESKSILTEYTDIKEGVKLEIAGFEKDSNIEIFSFVKSGNVYYVSIYGGGYSIGNEIYRLDTKNPQKIEVTKLLSSKPKVEITKNLSDKYFVLSQSSCYECEPLDNPDTTIILNINNKTTKNLGRVGEVSIRLNNSTVSYRKLSKHQENCPTQTPTCGIYDASYINVWKPEGETITEPLP
ncbi:MAG: hypothetical protein Q7S79_01320, partial [bacterium]|nr:hypothetical protein [bacterium]